ncbi:MAG: hypothetical protein J4428_04430 [Candidatus Aenigmarchaeota archaeon]|nr:hypothetical protein [Candidatus Aenigmarchaeota archaeon]
MIKKGIAWFPIALFIMLLSSLVVPQYFFTKEAIYKKRVTQETLLSLGNEVETYFHLLENAGNLALLQAVHDIGNGVIIDPTTDTYYDTNNHLPYFDELQKKEIIRKMEQLSDTYFSNYVNSYKKHLDERNQEETNKNFASSWDLRWYPDVHVIEYSNKIEASFGKVLITYSLCKLSKDTSSCELEKINIKREIKIESKIKTSFDQAIDISEKIINEFKTDVQKEHVCCSTSPTFSSSFPSYSWQEENECKTDMIALRLPSREENCEPNTCSGMCTGSSANSGNWHSSSQICTCKFSPTSSEATSDDVLKNIESKYKTTDIEVVLTKNNKFVTVSVFDKEAYGIYDFLTDNVKQKRLGLMFNIDFGSSSKIKYSELRDKLRAETPGLFECLGWSVISKRNVDATDICTIMLSKKPGSSCEDMGYQCTSSIECLSYVTERYECSADKVCCNKNILNPASQPSTA